jgi:hypothetical protein
LSSALLYLAIVVIWAFVLVPGWLHRSYDLAVEEFDGPAAAPYAEADMASDEYVPGTAADPEPDYAPRSTSERPRVRPPRRRAHVLQARRRALTTLVTLTAAAAGCALGGVAHWWLIAPPAGMLGVYLLLLREAGRADADAARRHADARAAGAELRARDAAQAEAEPQPTAEIIDISARVADQLYDQYADAAVRAVGD